MFPFGIFPFNIMPQMNPWWSSQSQNNQDAMPPMFKMYMDNYTAWTELMTKGNPWLSVYTQMLENMQTSMLPPKK